MPRCIRGAGGGTVHERWVLLLIGLVILAVDSWKLRTRARIFNDRPAEERNRNPASTSERTVSTARARTIGKSGGEITVRTQVVRDQSYQRKPALRRSKGRDSREVDMSANITNEKTSPKSPSPQKLASRQPEEFYSTNRENSGEQQHNQTGTASSRTEGSPTSQHVGPTFVLFVGLEGSGHHLVGLVTRIYFLRAFVIHSQGDP